MFYHLSAFVFLWTIAEVCGQQCDQTLTAEWAWKSTGALVGSGTCTWTITTLNDSLPVSAQDVIGSANIFMVELRFERVNMTTDGTCDVTNSIVVYDGDTSETILGIVCQNHFSAFQSTGRFITVQYPANEVTHTEAFSMKYKQIVPTVCANVEVHAAATEYTILTPGYPTGYTNVSFTCSWTLKASSEKRVLVVIDTGDGSTDCQGVNITIRNVLSRDVRTWCPGKPNYFASWKSFLDLKLQVSRGRSVRIKYKELEASSCGDVVDLNVTDEEQFITSPGYPAPFPSFAYCEWKFRATANYNGSTRLIVEESDLVTTEGCETDQISVISGFDDVIGKTCGGDPTSFYIYENLGHIIFRSSRPDNTRKGFKLKYFHGPAEPCGGNLTATSTNQKIESPGFPYKYPNSAECTWTLTAANTEKYIQVKFTTMDIFTPFSSCRDDYVAVYDGYYAGETARVCDEQTPTFQGLEKTFTIVFKTDRSFGSPGFSFVYKEVEVPQPVTRRISAKKDEKFLYSPRFPHSETQDLDVTWTFSPWSSVYPVKLTLSEVDMGDAEDCNNNYIKIFQGDSSSPLISKLCGAEMGSFINKGHLTVQMKTDSTLAKRGFKTKYSLAGYREANGCFGVPEEEKVYTSIILKTINYPNNYPNKINCTYILNGSGTYYRLILNILDMEMENSPGTNCTKDYIEVFDGNSTSSPSLGRFCSKIDKPLKSTDQFLVVRFISDDSVGAKGAQLNVTAVWSYEPSGEYNSYVWVIILVSVLGGLVIIVFIVFKILRSARKEGSATI